MLKQQPKAILFDMDGTLVDTIEDIRIAFNTALHLEDLPPISASLTKKIVGRGLYNALKGALDHYEHHVDEQRFLFLYQSMMEYYASHYADFSKPYAGILPFLKRIEQARIPFGILSNKEDVLTQKIVKILFSDIPFVFVRGLVDGFPRKPDSHAIDLFCSQEGVNVHDLCYIGDSEVDYQTAQNAGCSHILVSWGFRPKEELLALSGAVVVDTVDELEGAIYGVQ
ncbi:MAG: HAD family hydrolase [Sphaerochaeta sp.]